MLTMRQALVLVASGGFLLGLWALGGWERTGALDVAFVLAISVLLGRVEVGLPRFGSVSIHFLGALFGALLLPPGVAALTAALSLSPRTPLSLEREAFNRGQVGLATLLAGAVWEATGLYVLAAAVYLLLNLGAVALMARAMGLPWEVVLKNFQGYLVSFVGLFPFAYLMAQAYRTPLVAPWGGVDVLLFLLPALYAQALWRARTREEELIRKTVLALAQQVEARDRYTAFHSQRVVEIARDLARRMGLPYEKVELIYLGGLLHDIGKVGVPDAVLLKEGALTEEEWGWMRAHAVEGHRILAPLEPYLGQGVASIARSHHERWDGLGYPDGLKGEEIPLLARIVAVADAYEAMTSDRPYRRALSPLEAAARIASGAGSQFDPQVARVMMDLLKEDPPWKERQVFIRITAL